jgi:hypothetical protein
MTENSPCWWFLAGMPSVDNSASTWNMSQLWTYLNVIYYILYSMLTCTQSKILSSGYEELYHQGHIVMRPAERQPQFQGNTLPC